MRRSAVLITTVFPAQRVFRFHSGHDFYLFLPVFTSIFTSFLYIH